MKIYNRPSAPAWADLSTTDVGAAKAFYGGLFGWRGADVPMEEAGGYGMFLLGDEYVGGYGPCMAPGQPVAWLAYIQVESADATAAAVTGTGGSIVAGPHGRLRLGPPRGVRRPGGPVSDGRLRRPGAPWRRRAGPGTGGFERTVTRDARRWPRRGPVYADRGWRRVQRRRCRTA